MIKFCRKAFIPGALGFLAVVAFPALSGAELPIPSVPLWSASAGFVSAQSLTIDLDPSRPGVETITMSGGCTASAPDAQGLLNVTGKLKVKAYSADGLTTVFAPTSWNTVTSGKFPDPRLTQFQCGGAHATNYRAASDSDDADSLVQGSGVPLGPQSSPANCAHTFYADYALCDELPMRSLGLSVAKVGAERIVLVGQKFNVSYWNNIVNGDTNASGYSLSAYSLNGTLLWSKTFKAADSAGFEYNGAQDRLGDFLNDDGNDEIRLVAEGNKFKYIYINPKTGQIILTALVAAP